MERDSIMKCSECNENEPLPTNTICAECARSEAEGRSLTRVRSRNAVNQQRFRDRVKQNDPAKYERLLREGRARNKRWYEKQKLNRKRTA